MGIVLKGLEIENFKSYINRQCIYLSDLSVLLGANSSGKSTALQALLALKQTMECNSPDEELLLSGKYVTLGDYDDVASDPQKEGFSFAVILDQTEKSENSLEADNFKICWKFQRGIDGTSAILNQLEICFEDMVLSFKRSENGLHDLYVGDRRSQLSATIENLHITKYILHYDARLNNKASQLLSDLSHIIISNKVPTAALDEPVAVREVENFYFRLLRKLQSDENITAIESTHDLAVRFEKLIDDFAKMELPRYDEMTCFVPQNMRVQLLDMYFSSMDSVERLERLAAEYEDYLDEYKSSGHSMSKKQKSFELNFDPFSRVDMSKEKEDDVTQQKYAMNFYEKFYTNIISKIFFVGPIREMPKGLYNIGFENIPKYVGPTGSYFASVLLHENRKKREYILPAGKENCSLSEALAAWLVHLNIASAVDVDKKNSFGFSVSIENMEQIKSDIMNVGIGTSQVLPVLITMLLSEPDEILVFEQPELHLHPYSQSHLADMFVQFCKAGRKVVLETHSEYILLRLRYHIVRENYSEKAVDINFFCNSGGTKVEHANISGMGNIKYPVDFRDETQELLDAILEAALERKGLS